MTSVTELLDGKLKVKEAIEVGTKAVEYFRGGDFYKYICKNTDDIVKRVRHTSTASTRTDTQARRDHVVKRCNPAALQSGVPMWNHF